MTFNAILFQGNTILQHWARDHGNVSICRSDSQSFSFRKRLL